MLVDDFEKEYPDFDWKNTPAYKHPGGKNCPCPKHEYIREQINFAKQVNDAGSDAARVTLKFCPDHYQVYIKEVIPAMPLKYKILTKIALKIVHVQNTNIFESRLILQNRSMMQDLMQHELHWNFVQIIIRST